MDIVSDFDLMFFFGRVDQNIFVCSENYPYFRADDDRWKNSVRHNLSMNPHFRKGTKSKNGAGHVWVLAQTEGEGSGGVSVASSKDYDGYLNCCLCQQIQLDLAFNNVKPKDWYFVLH